MRAGTIARKGILMLSFFFVRSGNNKIKVSM